MPAPSRYDVIIVGGGPAGLTAGLYTARAKLKTLLVEGSAIGGRMAEAWEIENYPGFTEPVNGYDLSQKMYQQATRFGVEHAQTSVTAIVIDGADKTVTTNIGDYAAPAVIIAGGSERRKLGVPGEKELVGRGVSFCATCDGPFYRGAEQLMVLGGGNSGLEEGLFLAQFVDRVTVVDRHDRLAGSRVLRDKVLAHPKMEVLLGRKVTAFRPKEDGSGKIGTVLLERLDTGEVEEHHPAGVFVFVGLDPNTGFLGGLVELDERGFVVAGADFMTSIPGVFAAGDVRQGSTKQLASAVGEGAAVAIQIRRYLERQLEMAGRDGP